MAAGWRFLAQRLDGNGTSSEFLDTELPLQDVAITDTLSGPSHINAKIAPEVARLLGPDGRPILDKWGTAIYAEHEREIRGGAILTEMSRQGPTLSLDCDGFAAYPDGQPWTTDTGFMGIRVDPLDVVRVIWDHLQEQPGGNLGMTIDRSTSTPIRIGSEYRVATLDPQDDPNVGPSTFESGPVLLRWYETHDLGEEIVKLADETPFDYVERHQWVGDEVHHYLDFGYPRLGRKREDLRFVLGVNVGESPDVETDEYASEILALGHGEGRTMQHAVVSRPTGKLRRAMTVVDKSARSQRRVNALAKRELAWRSGLDDVTSFVAIDHPNAPIGSFSVGDEVLLEGRTGWGELEIWVRIISTTIRPAQGGAVEFSVIRSDKISL